MLLNNSYPRKLRLWRLGAAEIPNPYKLANGLGLIVELRAKGIHNYDNQQNLATLGDTLVLHGIVELGNDDTYSVGRKWRSALNKLGFLYPEVPSASGIPQSEIGPIDMITPNGWRLIRADTVPAMQECFLRALAAHYIPSALERKFD